MEVSEFRNQQEIKKIMRIKIELDIEREREREIAQESNVL